MCWFDPVSNECERERKSKETGVTSTGLRCALLPLRKARMTLANGITTLRNNSRYVHRNRPYTLSVQHLSDHLFGAPPLLFSQGKARENFLKRLQEIELIAARKLSPYDGTLSINAAERERMWKGIASDIECWKGVEITSCTTQKTSYKLYAITSRNWWNRNKAKVYGNHFFYAALFVHIKQVCSITLRLSCDLKNGGRLPSYMFLEIMDGE